MSAGRPLRSLLVVGTLLLAAAACGGTAATGPVVRDAASADAAAFCDRLTALERHDPAAEVGIGTTEHLDQLRAAVEGTPADVQRGMQRLVEYLAGLDPEDVPAAADYPEEVGEGIIAVQEYRAEVCPDWPPESHEH